MKGRVSRNRDGKRSFFWEVGCSLCIMTGQCAASAGFLLYLQCLDGFQDGASGRRVAIHRYGYGAGFLMETIDHETAHTRPHTLSTFHSGLKAIHWPISGGS